MGWITALFYSKFKAFFILGFSGIGAGSIAIPTLVAGDRFEDYLFREFNPKPANYAFNSSDSQAQVSAEGQNRYTTNQSQFSNFPIVKVSTAQLIKGTKSYNSGNYVIYFGSEACSNCNNFLYSEYESPKIWFGTDQTNLYRNGIFYETYSLVKHQQKNVSNSKLKDLKFIFFSDEVPSMANRNNDDLVTIPWNKWTNTSVSQGKVVGDYIRYDKSAVEFRKIQSLLFYYFGEKAKGIPSIIIYKDGVPFIYGSDKLKGIEEEKEKTGEQIKSMQESTAEQTSQAVILRYDLFKHLKYIFESEYIWYL